MNPVLQGAGHTSKLESQGSGQSRGTAASQCGGHPKAGSSPAPSEGCIDSGSLGGIVRKAETRDSMVETTGFHNNQLNQDIIHAKPLFWAT